MISTLLYSPVKKLYWILVKEIRVHPTARVKYNSIYDDQDFNWKQIYLIPQKVTLDTRTRFFQYKLLNYIACTNGVLKKELSDTSFVRFVKSIKNPSSICSYTVDSAKKKIGCKLFPGWTVTQILQSLS